MSPQSQAIQSNMTPEDAKASLGIATHLQDQLMPQQAPQEPTSPANEPGASQPAPQQDITAEIQGLETRITDELKTIREEMKTQGDGKAELADLKKQIEQILNE